jgi:hypothetical protein
MLHLNSCQFKAPCFFSKKVPINKISTNKEKKIKICFLKRKILNFQERGKWMSNKISISKIINRIINMKNRIEKGFRLELKVSIPHSNALLDSRALNSNQNDKINTKTTNTSVNATATITDSNKFILSNERIISKMNCLLINLIQEKDLQILNLTYYYILY